MRVALCAAGLWLAAMLGTLCAAAAPELSDQERKARMTPEEAAWEKILEENLGSFYLPGYKSAKAKGTETAWDYVKDDPRLPRVLLIGDSVSRGYTLDVRHALAGKVNLHRAPANCGSTTAGLKKLDIWLGDGRWDLIHFNFGLHNLRTPSDEYEQQLTQIVERLKKTGAKLLFATTTPVPNFAEKKLNEQDPVRLNEVARRVMAKHGVAIDDLYSHIRPTVAEDQNPNDVHFKAAGYKRLGEAVAASILAALPGAAKQGTTKP